MGNYDCAQSARDIVNSRACMKETGGKNCGNNDVEVFNGEVNRFKQYCGRDFKKITGENIDVKTLPHVNIHDKLAPHFPLDTKN